jgi:hypothetical protein
MPPPAAHAPPGAPTRSPRRCGEIPCGLRD